MMLKNNVFQVSVSTKKWAKATMIRAIKTFCQSAVSLITVGQMVTNLNWVEIIGISVTSAIISVLTSVAGLPEVTQEKEVL